MVQEICQTSDEFSPELLHNTGSFGNLFEVQTKDNPVNITEIALSTDLDTNITYHVWTKAGTYGNDVLDEGSWTKIAEGWTIAQGRDQPTPIPVESFTSVRIESNQMQSFIVMLDTPDILYNFGRMEGITAEEHEDLIMYEGKGVASFPPFFEESRFFAPRVFTGVMKYVVEKPCEEPSLMPSFKPSISPSSNPTVLPSTPMPTMLSSVNPTLGPMVTQVEFMYLFAVGFDEVVFVYLALQETTESVLEEFLNGERGGNSMIDGIIEDGELSYDGGISLLPLDTQG